MSSPVALPWWTKIAGKLVLSRLPVPYERWAGLNLFRHGRMDEPAYAQRVFDSHMAAARFSPRARPWVGLELGPGDTASSAIIGAAYGAERMFLVDSGAFARQDPAPYAEMRAFLRGQGHAVPSLDGESFPEVLEACRGTYLTDGLASLRALPDRSVDFSWSHAVLEHVRGREFLATMRELRRVLRPSGVSSHQVDLRDHFEERLNSLRIPQRLWEAEWFAKHSGFYTNRIRFSAMLRLFEQAGFAVEVVSRQLWDEVPTRRSGLAKPFRDLPDEELCVAGFHAVLRAAGSTQAAQSSHRM